MSESRKGRGAAPTAPTDGALGIRAVAIIFSVALLVRLLYLVTLSGSPFFGSPVLDSYWHHTWAQAVAAGRWGSEGAFFRAPLYPFLLGQVYRLFGDGPWAARIVQQLIGSVSCVLIAVLATRLTGRRRVGWIAGGIAAFYGTLIYYEGELLMETLIVGLDLVVLVWLAAMGARRRPVMFLGPGLVLGLSAIARPTILIFWLPLWIWLFLHRESGTRTWLLRGAALTVALLVPVLAVTAINASRSGDFVLVASQGGVNLYIGNNAASDGKTVVAPGAQRKLASFEDNVWISSKAVAEEELGRPLKASEVSRYWSRKALGFWLRSPGAAIALTLRKTYYFFHGYEVSNNVSVYFSREWSWVLYVLLWNHGLYVPFGLVGPLGLVGAAIQLRRRGAGPAARGQTLSLLMLFGVSYTVSVIAFFVNGRFRLPVVPAFIVFAAVTIDCAARRSFFREFSRYRLGLAATVLLIGLLNAPLLGITTEVDPAWELGLVGIAYQQDKKYGEAIPWYLRALDASPDHPQILGNLGTLYLEEGQLDQAREYLSRAIQVSPTQVEAVVNLSNVYIERGLYDDAAAICRDALRVDPDLHPAAFNLGRALLAMGRSADAAQAFAQAVRLEPDDPRYLQHEAVALLQAGRCGEAVPLFRRAVELDPDNSRLELGLGLCLLQTGDTESASEALTRAYTLDKTESRAALNLGLLCEREGDTEQAKLWYERSLEVREDPVALTNLAYLLAREGQDLTRVAQLLERATELKPNDASLFLNLGRIYERLGQKDKSAAALDRARRLDPRLRR